MISHHIPNAEECSGYFRRYVDLVPDANIYEILAQQKEATLEKLSKIKEEKADFAYEPGKWTLKEVFLHLMDTERVFAYRALRFARNDNTKLPGFEQDQYIPFTASAKRSLSSVKDEYASVRNATLTLLKSMDDIMLDRFGNASGTQLSCRAVFFIIAGHELHHWKVIEERYLSGE